MRLYIVRHGRTDWNVESRLQGRTNIPLNEEGRFVARRSCSGLKNISFDAVISSPLDRALETAQLLLDLKVTEKSEISSKKRNRLDEKHLPYMEDLSDRYGMPFFTDRRIMEMSFGIYEGLSGYNPKYKLEDPDFHNFSDRPEIFKAPEQGENCWDVFRRTGDFLMDLAEQAALQKENGQEKTYLISTHGAVCRALLTIIEQKPIMDFWKDGVPKNCAVSIAESFGEPWRLLEKDKLFYENI